MPFDKKDDKFRALLILISLGNILYYLYDYFTIDYFVDIGLAERLSSFCFSCELLIASLVWKTHRSLALSVVTCFIIGNILDRFSIALIYWAHPVLWRVIWIPLLSAIIVYLFQLIFEIRVLSKPVSVWFYTITGLIILLPKVFF